MNRQDAINARRAAVDAYKAAYKAAFGERADDSFIAYMTTTELVEAVTAGFDDSEEAHDDAVMAELDRVLSA